MSGEIGLPLSRENFVFFWGSESPFSQWYNCKFNAFSTVNKQIKEKTFYTTEQYMMAEKALLFNDRYTYEKIMIAKTPKEYKKLGREVKNFNESTWKKNRFNIVKNGNLHKFFQNDKLKIALYNTNNKIMVEASPYDKIWGIGMKETNPNAINPKKWKGLNLLGEALMEVREELFTKNDKISEIESNENSESENSENSESENSESDIEINY